MSRQYIDCREFPSATNCIVAVHGHTDTPELHKQLSALFKTGTPPLRAPTRKAA